MYNNYSIFLKYYVFKSCTHENILSSVAVDTGSVQNICINVYSWNNSWLHNFIALSAVFEDFPKRTSFNFH